MSMVTPVDPCEVLLGVGTEVTENDWRCCLE